MFNKERIIFTIGHSTHSLENFIFMLQKHDIKMLVDVRRFPTSRKHPQFQKEVLEKGLSRVNIGYQWLGDFLGGYRTGGYKAYTRTETFQQGLQQLEALAQQQTTAFMCAELLFFRCHRRFIADKLVERGWRVFHIMEKAKLYQHKGGRHEQDNR